MGRLTRVAPVGIPQHIVQRGNYRQVCLGLDEDMVAYISWLKEYANKYQVATHAWVLMINHIHLLATPYSEGGISKMLQSLGRRYVRYFNYTYQRSGTLWEGGEFGSDRADYGWSSYQCNALGKKSELLAPHERYSLGR